MKRAAGAVGSRFDYVTVGHVTIDVLADGTRRPGGSAFYSAVQAARLGARTAILTRGVPAEIEAALEPYLGEFELLVEPAHRTTRLATTWAGPIRNQRVLAWAGQVSAVEVDAALLHLAPVAQEIAAEWREASADFIGLTPQGLARAWGGEGGQMRLAPAEEDARELALRCDALVLSEDELASCAALFDAAVGTGASVAITAGASPTKLFAHGLAVELDVLDIGEAIDDLGAGDVFAAAFFIALAEGQGPASAAAFAHAAAALRVSGRGAQAIAARAAIDERARVDSREAESRRAERGRTGRGRADP
ncbi:MAG TPA: PfkB family carbohydrate kinase [Solirubrobacteraceae bacterium]|nr:PfkB family carbohydrate kinase [Solirubrobacteraceae bacterium]